MSNFWRMPQLSIIIPTLNEADHLPNLLSYLKSTSNWDAVECIITDGGSTDATLAIAKQAGVIVYQARAKGRGAQLAEAATLANGSWLYFLHADTIPPDSWYQDWKMLMATQRYMACYRYKFQSNRFILAINAWFTRLPFMWCRGGDQGLFIARHLYDKVGGFDPKFVIMEEYDLLKRAKKYCPLYIIPKYALVSARKYTHNAYLRVNVANLIVFNLWRIGVKPLQLHHIYQRLLHHPKGDQ